MNMINIILTMYTTNMRNLGNALDMINRKNIIDEHGEQDEH